MRGGPLRQVRECHIETPSRRAWRAIQCLGLILGFAACSPDHLTTPGDRQDVQLVVTADVRATAIHTVVIVVTAPDITDPLGFNIDVVDGVASGHISVPTGSARTFTAHGYDAGGVETHRGAVTADVQPGGSAPLAISLDPLVGDVPVIVTIQSLRVTVAPAVDSVAVDEATRLVAAITLSGGSPVAGHVQWASLNPGIATVDTGGLVTGHAPGSVQVVATYGGVGGAATIVVFNAADVPPALRLVASGLSAALFVTAPPGDTSRVLIVQQTGQVRVLRNDTLLATPFLDISGLVSCCGEQGLLGLAFHPQYAANGFFFVNYTDATGSTRVARYRVSANPNVADQGSASIVLTQAQPFSNHNGGMLAFGPDGYLYIGLGDGGSGGDPLGNGQNLGTLLGKLLRIDVDGASPYAVPATNPFVGVAGVRPEIWASGLRNPWRFSFDRITGDLYIGDVGQSAREEVDVQPAASPGGQNYGWNVMEGFICYAAVSCSQTGLTLPVLDYPHTDGCAITGGYVYRGARVPILAGRYLYSDYCTGFVRSFRFQGGQATDPRDWSMNLPLGGSVTSFGEDARGEVYVAIQSGSVYRIVRSF